MVRSSLLAFALAAATAVSAVPHGRKNTEDPQGGWDSWMDSWTNGHWGRGATPTLPLNEVDNTGASPLPTPTSTVKYVLLGVGFQNYTCGTNKTWVQTVPSAGAIANLYDITRYVSKDTKDTITSRTLHAFETCLKKTHCQPVADNGFCSQCHNIAAAPFRHKLVGEHFFDQVNGVQSPNFNIWRYNDFLSAKKAGAVSAPASAYKGENGLGAVAWLYLIPNGSPATHGLKSVYRIETAGGTAPSSCDTLDSQLQIPYTAEYWFYN